MSGSPARRGKARSALDCGVAQEVQPQLEQVAVAAVALDEGEVLLEALPGEREADLRAVGAEEAEGRQRSLRKQ